MPYQLGVEDIEPDHLVAWVLDLPGCYSSAPTVEEAVARAPACILAYFAWRAEHGDLAASPPGEGGLEVADVFHSWIGEGDYAVNAFFADDRGPLSRPEVEDALQLLDYSRRDLLAMLGQAPPERLRQPIAGEVQGSIAGILSHIAGAELWYLCSLDPTAEPGGTPEDPIERLGWVRTETRLRLPRLVGDSRVVNRVGERWSARKILRRTLWHERDHTEQIGRLLVR